jgi:hypothetical protein
MEKQAFLALAASPGLIPGIYNYCDSWCERCAFTSRCLNYLSRQALGTDPTEEEIDSGAFLEKITASFALTKELLKDAAKEHDIDLDYDEMEMESFLQEREDERKIAEKSTVSTLANHYMMLGTAWLKRCKVPLDKKEQELNQSLRLGLQDQPIVEQAKQISEAIEVVSYYILFIYTKLMRAQSDRKMDDAWFEENGFPKDSDGSAKIALIAIDRSITCWSLLFKQLQEEEDAILEMLGVLDQLRKEVEITFPNARTFIRPGFDET